MSTENIKMTEAEWNVMESLWEKSPQTGRELVENLAEKTGWSRSTTLTLVARLEAKGAVGTGKVGAIKGFYPLVRREDASLREAKHFLDRIYNGSVSMMVSSLTKKQALSQTEIDELYAMLKELEGGKDG